MNDTRTIAQRTEAYFLRLAKSLTDTEEVLHDSMCVNAHSITDGFATKKAQNALIEALADLEQQCALCRWTAASAAMQTPNDELDVGLIVHTRGQSGFDFVEGHAIALIEIVARMREIGEKREDVLDMKHHLKCLVDLGKSFELPRKARKPRKRR